MSMDHSFSKYTKFFEKLTFLTPTGKRACAYQGVRDVVFWKILILHTQEHIKKYFLAHILTSPKNSVGAASDLVYFK